LFPSDSPTDFPLIFFSSDFNIFPLPI
jgi:hypothetical protein